MQYFRHQLEARQLSRRLVLLFMLGVICVTLAISGVLLTLAATLSNGLIFVRMPDGPWLREHPAAVIATVLLVLGVMAVAVLLKRIELREGGGAVARSLGGERVTADSSDTLYRRLHNVVEEMAIAAGIALPEVYVLPREAGINAFAAGLTPADAAIAVTRGALEQLNRDELQGVVAHEFSHIVNNDIRLNMHLIGWLHGLMALSVIARGMLRFSTGGEGRGRRSGVPMLWLAALAVMVLGYVGMIFGRLLQAAVARRRETLADASAIQFTRNPDGLRNALLKIAATTDGGQLQQVSTDEVAHMMFFPPGEHWFATHPPLAERISMLGGRFDPAELQRVRQKLQSPAPASAASAAEIKPSVVPAEAYLSNLRLSAAQVIASVGSLQPQHLQFAHQLRISLPDSIVSAAANMDAAVALLFALSLDRTAAQRAAQMQHLNQSLGAAVVARVQALLPVVDALNPRQRQPALLRLLPQLRQLADVNRMRISSCLRAITEMTGSVSVEKYALCKLAQSQLHDAFATRERRVTTVTLWDARNEVATLLAVLTRQGHAQVPAARHAYERAMRHLGVRDYPEYAPVESCNRLLDAALITLDRLHPMGKQALLEAMMLAVLHDEQITVEEAELLRAFCACLHCPLPPLLQAEAAAEQAR